MSDDEQNLATLQREDLQIFSTPNSKNRTRNTDKDFTTRNASAALDAAGSLSPYISPVYSEEEVSLIQTMLLERGQQLIRLDSSVCSFSSLGDHGTGALSFADASNGLHQLMVDIENALPLVPSEGILNGGLVSHYGLLKGIFDYGEGESPRHAGEEEFSNEETNTEIIEAVANGADPAGVANTFLFGDSFYTEEYPVSTQEEHATVTTRRIMEEMEPLVFSAVRDALYVPASLYRESATPTSQSNTLHEGSTNLLLQLYGFICQGPFNTLVISKEAEPLLRSIDEHLYNIELSGSVSPDVPYEDMGS